MAVGLTLPVAVMHPAPPARMVRSRKVSWLIFMGRLADFDKGTVTAQHRAMDRPLAPHFKTAYEMALQCRLNLVLPSSPNETA